MTNIEIFINMGMPTSHFISVWIPCMTGRILWWFHRSNEVENVYEMILLHLLCI